MKTIFNKYLILPALLLVNIALGQNRTLTLNEAIVLASKGNKSLLIQRTEEKRYGEIAKESNAKLLPSIAVAANASHYFDRQVIFLPGSFTGTANPVQDVRVGGLNTFNSTISLSQPLLLTNALREKKVALVEQQIQSEKTKDLEAEMIYQVSKDYYGILLMDSQMKLQEKSLARNIKALEDSKSLYREGRGLKVDTLRAYIQVENLKSSVAHLKSQIEIAKSRFKRLIGLPQEEEIALQEEALTGDAILLSFTDSSGTAEVSNRKDILVQKLSITLEEKKLSASKSQRLPQVSLVGQYQLQAQADDLDLETYTWPETSFVGLQLSIPLFTGGSLNSKVKQREIAIQKEKLRLDELKDQADDEISTVRSNYKNALSQFDIYKRTLEAAELNYTMNSNRYSNGIGSKLETTDAEVILSNAQFNFLQATYELKIIDVEMRKAMGLLKI